MKKLSLVLIGLMACLAIGIATSQGQIFYTVEDLGVVKGMDVVDALEQGDKILAARMK